ncbi:type II toxin-antitoxin system RelE/ParE family toxin [Flavobacterium hauense]
MAEKLSIIWSSEAISDLKSVFVHLQESNSKETSLKIRSEIFNAPYNIIFPEQYQSDEYRRVIVRNYKIYYTHFKKRIQIVGIFNTSRHPSKMRR